MQVTFTPIFITWLVSATINVMGNWNCAGGNFDDNHTRRTPRTQYDSEQPTLTVSHQQDKEADEEADSVDAESISLPQLQLDTQVQQIGDKKGMS